MPPNNQRRGGKKGGGKIRNAAGNLLDQLGIPGNFQKLVRRAVLQGWDADEFAMALIRTRGFKQAFPGLVNKGRLHIDFGGGAGASATLQAVTNYRTGFDNFQAVANSVGYGGKITEKLYGFAVRQDVSPEEFGKRLQLINILDTNPGLLDMVNEQRTFDGLTPYANESELLKAAATNSPDFVDHYQAAYLRSQGLELDAGAAANLARTFDSPLEPNMNLGFLVAQVRAEKSKFLPELREAGITDEDLFLMATGSDPGGKSLQLQQIYSRKQLQAQTAQQHEGSRQGSRSSTGGFSLFPEDEPQSY